MGSPRSSSGFDVHAGIFWAVVIGFLLGIFARSVFLFDEYFALFLGALALASFFLGLLDRKRMWSGVALAVLFASAALGIVRMDIAALSGDSALTDRIGQRVTVEGIVSAEPDARDTETLVAISVSKIVSPVHANVHAGVLATLPVHAPLAYGDQVRAWGVLKAPEAFDTGVGREFDYPGYLAAQGIEYQLSLAQAEVMQDSVNQGNPLQRIAIDAKEAFERGISRALPEPEAGLASGITVGDKRGVGADLTNTFQTVGLVHMVVLSGYNITVVLSAAEHLVARAPRIAQFGVSGFVVAFFILMAGGAGSATRAGLMALVAVLARATHRQFLASRALALAAFLIVLWNPFELVFDPSFQLSALATAGLIAFSPIVAAHLGWIPEKFALREIASATLGTQIAVLPLLLYQNGLLPIYTLPANLFALVAVPLAMALSLVAGIGGLVLGALSVIVAFPAYLVLAYIIRSAQLFAALPYASVALPPFNAWWMALVYAILFAGAWIIHEKKSGGTESL